MCGLAGFLRIGGSEPEAMQQELRAMCDIIAHRGPDGDGYWVDGAPGIALGHRRLAIVDLSPAGAQPMTSGSGRYVCVYNGEIYNAPELRQPLEAAGIVFRGHSDTEVMLALFDRDGVAETLPRLVGMFAIALWDRQEQRLHLIRDHVGIKPLAWGRVGNRVVFGSQAKSFTVLPEWTGRVNRDALAAYLRVGYLPAPHSAWAGIAQLRPGHRLEINRSGQVQEFCWWDATQTALAGLDDPFRGDQGEAEEALAAQLGEAVRCHLMSDVPVGTFLSGGIDSSTVTALMCRAAGGAVRSYSIGFDEAGYNEAPHAAAVARHLGTDHHERTVTAAQAQAAIPELPEWYDEPFADSSQIPTLIVSRLAAQDVKVVLSGDGGDELFAGYSRYHLGKGAVAGLAALPRIVRIALAAAIRTVPPGTYDAMARMTPGLGATPMVGDKAHKLARMLGFDGAEPIYRGIVSQIIDPARFLPGSAEPLPAGWADQRVGQLPEALARMQLLDMHHYLPDDILVKVDRAAMAVGLEGRVPLLDPRVIQLAWRFPAAFKHSGGVSKRVLRSVLYRQVPSSLVERPKMGFGLPIGEWLKGALRPWAEDLLSERAIRQVGLLDSAPVRTLWEQHQSGQHAHQYGLWNLLMLQAWAQRWKAAP